LQGWDGTNPDTPPLLFCFRNFSPTTKLGAQVRLWFTNLDLSFNFASYGSPPFSVKSSFTQIA
jgi:hypothetical protein